MVTTIKNLTNKKLTFDALEVSASGELSISWTKTKMTYEAYALVIGAYLSGEIDFLNNKGKSIKKVKKRSYHVLEEKNGKVKKVKKTKDVDIALDKLNNQFSEMMNSYLD